MASTATSIEWTDATWNPTVGCDRISPGCAKCYAKELHDRRHKAFLAGKDMAPQYAKPFESLQLMADRLDAPLHWRKPRRIFVNSVSDLFHEDVPDAFIDRVMLTIVRSVYHTFQVLTKRPARMRDYFSDRNLRARIDRLGLINNPLITPRGKLKPTIVRAWPLPTLWLGVSVENQHFADERISLLLKTPAAVRFISAEPLLGPVNLKDAIERGLWDVANSGKIPPKPAIDWVIVGSESGAGARPMQDDWVRSLRDECGKAGVAFFFKQRSTMSGKKIGLPELDGKVWNEFPQITDRPSAS